MIEENTLNLFWVVVSAVLVFFMQVGFLCLETGLTRSKNNINVAVKNLADFGVSTFLFWLIGFGLMFGTTTNGIIGIDRFGLNLGDSFDLAIFFIFQVMFCGTAITILSGGVAERLQFNGYMIITILVSTLIYPVFGHWAWGGADMGQATGFLGSMGFVDFAGSTVVHSVGGWVTLAALLIVGARTNRFNTDGSPNEISGSSLPMAAMGTLILYVGWLGFNGGSHLAFGQDTARTLVNTLMAGSFGLVTAMLGSHFLFQKIKVGLLLNGILAGLVSITAVAHAVTTGQTAIIAIVGSIVMITIDVLLVKVKIDDAVGAIPVHLGAGIWGTLAVGLFGDLDLLATGLSRPEQIGVQLMGIVVAAVWAGLIPYLILSQIGRFTQLRVTPEEEHVGLNISEHGARSELLDMFTIMDTQFKTGDLSLRVPEEPFTLIGQISEKYNLIMERLEQLSRQTTSIIETANDGIVVFQEDGFTVTEMNPAASAILGFSGDQFIGKQFPNFFSHYADAEPNPDNRITITEFIDTNGYQEVTGYRSDGTLFPAEIAVSKVKTGAKTFFTGMFRDITERRNLIDAQAAAIQAAKDASEAKSNFLANMSHEIRTPLNAVIGLTTLLLETHLDDEQRDFLRTINNSGESLLVIINEILDFSKIEAGKLDLENHPLNLRECIEDVLDLMATKAIKKNLELAYSAQSLESDMFEGDVTRLRQVLINLVGNAIKFTDEGEIVVYLTHERVEDDVLELKFEVRDTGIGIPKDRLNALFEAFTQADESTTRKYGGTGLGLTISRKLAELMDGRMWVESEIGQGSSFFFTAKLRQLASTQNNTPSTTNMLGRKILIVDDNATNRLILSRALLDWGFETVEAEDGFAALEILNSDQEIDLGLFDMLMPGMDGLELAKKTKKIKHRAGMASVLLTSAGELAGKEVKEVFFANMSKPVRHGQLFNIIDSFFSGQSADTSVEPESAVEEKERLPLKILLVDDNKVNQKVGVRMLNRIGYDADTVDDGVQAVEAVQIGDYDLVFMDVQMPNMSGPEATKIIRLNLDIPRQPWIVALTANAMKGDREGYLANGMDGYLSKPLRINQLEDVIDELIRQNLDLGESA